MGLLTPSHLYLHPVGHFEGIYCFYQTQSSLNKKLASFMLYNPMDVLFFPIGQKNEQEALCPLAGYLALSLDTFRLTFLPSASRPQYWFVAVPFAILIWVYDEVRKLFIRLYPGSK